MLGRFDVAFLLIPCIADQAMSWTPVPLSEDELAYYSKEFRAGMGGPP